jgi:hypothetical protein
MYFEAGPNLIFVQVGDQIKRQLVVGVMGLIQIFFLGGGDFIFVLNSALLHLQPLRSHCAEDARIEPRTVATGALAVRRSNH